MITANVFQKGDKVMLKGIIAEVICDDAGAHKYRIKDEKSGLTFGTWYNEDELAEAPEEE